MGASSAAIEISERELVLTRTFDAPRALVFKAWTEPEQRARWIGPKGFTGSVLQMDLRPGGAYRFHMRSADGTDHWQQGVYREIVPPERLVCTYLWADAAGNAKGPETLLTVTFDERDGKTLLTLRQALFESVTARDAHRAGWSSSLERLAGYLAIA
ncbi:MAG TPA: SRPBCC domain-containing protein [Candidatus Binataceae bacterium]|nr:SRPBCC domain-containing protein [Candidatus Binataceae bacterium]